MTDLILATHNPGKIAELTKLLAPIKCMAQASITAEQALETGTTFIENALLKAQFISHMTNKAALAEDSGLVVPALNGQPGIFSARFAKEHASDGDNISYLLAQLQQTSQTFPFKAYFYCAMVVTRYRLDAAPLIAFGKLDGVIIDTPKGTHGFGYDPVFYLSTHQCTLAELPLNTKNTLSHRAQALNMLYPTLQHELLDNNP